jgi:hypothetical protein
MQDLPLISGWQRSVKRPVALPAKLGSGGRREGQWSGRDVEIDGADRVIHLSQGVLEFPAEFLGGVVPVVDAATSPPLHLERNNRWDRWVSVACYRILYVSVVLHVKILRFKGCSARMQVDLDITWGKDSSPEEAILSDSRVEIVNLSAP